MSILGSILGAFGGKHSNSGDDKGCDWYCDECGAYMNNQRGFTTSFGEWICTECGADNDVSDNNIYDDDDTESYDDDDMPECCVACGDPNYPKCMDSCKAFDD